MVQRYYLSNTSGRFLPGILKMEWEAVLEKFFYFYQKIKE